MPQYLNIYYHCSNGSVHAHMEVNVEGHSAKEIRSVLTEEFKDERPGELGRLVIDPQSVEVKKSEGLNFICYQKPNYL